MKIYEQAREEFIRRHVKANRVCDRCNTVKVKTRL